MDQVFPFDLPGATSWYTTLYVLTFALHQACMHYVLAGSLVVAWATIFPGRGDVPRHEQPLVAVLRDWIPFMLSAAITAGVAPLLFVQILYQQQFYTANLLLSWRWMVVIPALIIVFYLLYLLKTDFFWRWEWAVRSAVAVFVSAGVIFVGFCWTANYLLSTDEAAWPEVFATGHLPFDPTHVFDRMLVWIGGSFASLGVIAGWQLGGRSTGAPSDPSYTASARLLGRCALGGILVALVSGYLLLIRGIGEGVRLGDAVGWGYAYATAAGAAVQMVAWLIQLVRGRLARLWLVLATAGWLVTLVSASVVREQVRVFKLDVEGLAPRHAEATQIGGLVLFLVLAVINGAAIAWCVWIVRRGKGNSPD
jgi:hypothetical protein